MVSRSTGDVISQLYRVERIVQLDIEQIKRYLQYKPMKL